MALENKQEVPFLTTRSFRNFTLGVSAVLFGAGMIVGMAGVGIYFFIGAASSFFLSAASVVRKYFSEDSVSKEQKSENLTSVPAVSSPHLSSQKASSDFVMGLVSIPINIKTRRVGSVPSSPNERGAASVPSSPRGAGSVPSSPNERGAASVPSSPRGVGSVPSSPNEGGAASVPSSPIKVGGVGSVPSSPIKIGGAGSVPSSPVGNGTTTLNASFFASEEDKQVASPLSTPQSRRKGFFSNQGKSAEHDNIIKEADIKRRFNEDQIQILNETILNLQGCQKDEYSGVVNNFIRSFPQSENESTDSAVNAVDNLSHYLTYMEQHKKVRQETARKIEDYLGEYMASIIQTPNRESPEPSRRLSFTNNEDVSTSESGSPFSFSPVG